MKQVIIIAEAGVNHNGSIELAKKLVDSAVSAGADYVKFQTFKAEKLVSKYAIKAEYQLTNFKDNDSTQFSMLKKLELSDQMHVELISYCKKVGVKFMSTGFDEESINYLDELGLNIFKIPSGEITNKPYLQLIAKKGKPVLLSSGMAYLYEIEDAIKVMIDEGLSIDDITVLHCNTEYPTPMQDVNLKAMLRIRDTLKVKVGYSDHTKGIEISIAAVALGAQVIEKHFTLDRTLPGPDHKASLEPNELKLLISAIRNVEKALMGSGNKEPSQSEMKNRIIVRKSIHTSKFITKGKLLTKEDLIALRPGIGISPMEINKVIGKISRTELAKGSIINWEDLL
jgi:N-acetylneuraminate synthase